MTVDLSVLLKDGDTVALEDGRTLRLSIVPDTDASINDYELDGRYVPCGPVDERPQGMTDRARRLQVGRSDWVWWEPPSPEMTGVVWDEATMNAEASRITDLIECGFFGVILEVLDGVDAHGRPIVEEVASLWGINLGATGAASVVGLDDGYLSEVVCELVAGYAEHAEMERDHS